MAPFAAATEPFDLPMLGLLVLQVIGAVFYMWFYLGWISDSDYPHLDDSSLLRLRQKYERLRWYLAAAAIWIVFLEVCLRRVESWGIYVTLLVVASAYLRDGFAPMGGLQLSPGQKAIRRRWTIPWAALVLFYGTDFSHGSFLHAVILVIVTLIFVILVLVPEPAQ